ncbi:MAG: hypothetical protein ACEQSB_07380 [Undibacterium sp.]
MKELEARENELMKMLRTKKEEDDENRYTLGKILGMSMRGSYGFDKEPTWGEIRGLVAGLKEKILTEGALLPFVERGYIRENQKLWHLVRAFIADPTLPKPNEKNMNTMTEGPFGGEERADFSRG